ncbi:MAG TPA: calcium:proton antiporter [Devosiaceae bacterium]|nr:calcium:proton antiporter [Devosiaceae bacterium]
MGDGYALGVEALPKFVRTEWFLAPAMLSAVAFLAFGDALFDRLGDPLWLAFVFGWLFAVVLGSALSVVRHADHVAAQLGEPYGTLILTLSITAMEVIGISAVMLHGANNPTLVRDTLFAVIMIVLNGMVGLSLLAGAWRRREQHFNLQGANAYLGLIVPLAALSLIMPNFMRPTHGPFGPGAPQIVLGLMSIGLYCTFLLLQAGRHRGYFAERGVEAQEVPRPPSDMPLWLDALLLVVYMVPVVFLVEQLALPIDYLIETVAAPTAIGGAIMAILVATPEAIGAVRAASADHLQRSINIFLGSVLSTIGLTVPAMLLISHLTGHPVTLGLEHSDVVMLVLTLAVGIITFASGRTNVLQGAVHLLLFVAYLLLLLSRG